MGELKRGIYPGTCSEEANQISIYQYLQRSRKHTFYLFEFRSSPIEEKKISPMSIGHICSGHSLYCNQLLTHSDGKRIKRNPSPCKTRDKGKIRNNNRFLRSHNTRFGIPNSEDSRCTAAIWCKFNFKLLSPVLCVEPPAVSSLPVAGGRDETAESRGDKQRNIW